MASAHIPRLTSQLSPVVTYTAANLKALHFLHFSMLSSFYALHVLLPQLKAVLFLNIQLLLNLYLPFKIRKKLISSGSLP